LLVSILTLAPARRHFPQVEYVRNITDIDDKIIQRAVENKEDIYALTNRFIAAMHEDEQAGLVCWFQY
jgi:cysteinyl-tRNA synthetase